MARQWEVVTHTAQRPQQTQRGYCLLWQEWPAPPRPEVTIAQSAARCSGGKNWRLWTVPCTTASSQLPGSFLAGSMQVGSNPVHQFRGVSGLRCMVAHQGMEKVMV